MQVSAAATGNPVTAARVSTAIDQRDIPGRMLGIAAPPTLEVARAAAVATDQGVLTWDLDSGRRIAFPAAGRHTAPTAVTYSGDGQTIELGTTSGLALIPAFPDSPRLSNVAADTSPALVADIDAVTPLRAGILVAATGAGTLAVVDLASSRLEPWTGAATTAVAFSPGGKLLVTNAASSNRSESLALVHPTAGVTDSVSMVPAEEWWPNNGSNFFVESAVVTGRYAVAAGQDANRKGAVMVWDAATGKPLRLLPLPGGSPDLAVAVVVSTRLDLIVARNEAGEVVAWSTRTWQERFRINLGEGSDLALPGSTDTLVATVSDGPATNRPAGRRAVELAQIDLRTGRVIRRVHVDGGVATIAASPDGRRTAIATSTDRILFMDAAGRLTDTGIDTGGQPLALAFSPDGARLAVSRADGWISIVDVDTGFAAIPAIRDPGGDIAVFIAWDPTGTLLAASAAVAQPDTLTADRVDVWSVSPAMWARSLCAVLGPTDQASEWRGLLDRDPLTAPVCAGRPA
jgi:WD40 repeat protein